MDTALFSWDAESVKRGSSCRVSFLTALRRRQKEKLDSAEDGILAPSSALLVGKGKEAAR